MYNQRTISQLKEDIERGKGPIRGELKEKKLTNALFAPPSHG
jgi:hypothetical protein